MKLLNCVLFGLMSFACSDFNASDSNSASFVSSVMGVIAQNPKICAGGGYVVGSLLYQAVKKYQLNPVIDVSHQASRKQGLQILGFKVTQFVKSDNLLDNQFLAEDSNINNILKSYPNYEIRPFFRNKATISPMKPQKPHGFIKYRPDAKTTWALEFQHKVIKAGIATAALFYGVSLFAKSYQK